MTIDLDNVRLFSGNAHEGLAKEIAAYLEINKSDIDINQFSNENFEVQLGTSVRGKDVFILQPLVPPTSNHLMELLLMLDTARSSVARSIHAIIPHYSYGRSDKKDAPRISIAGRLVADLLVTAGAQHIITMTLHSPQIHGFFSVPTDHLTAHSVLMNYFKSTNLDNAVIVSPDIGNAKRAGALAKSLKLPLAIAQKLRLTDRKVSITNILGDVKGKHAIIVDDEIATGGTIEELVNHLTEVAGVESVTVACTHGLFLSDAVERLDALNLKKVVTTNTVPLKPEQCPRNLEVLSVAHIFGEVIRRTIGGQSVGAMYEFWPDDG
jgi:ribose-phosphate pyrophosphokinase